MFRFDTKPVLKILLPFVFGIVFAKSFQIHWAWFILPAAGACIACLVFYHLKKSSLFTIFTLTVFALLGAFFYSYQLSFIRYDDVRRFNDGPDPVTVEGVIKSPVYEKEQKHYFYLSVDSLWTFQGVAPVSGKILVNLHNPHKKLKYGDRVVLKGGLRQPSGAGNPGAFDYQQYLAIRGVFSILTVLTDFHSIVMEEHQGNFLYRQGVLPVRNYILATMDRFIPGQNAALLKGLLVGAREGIDRDLLETFSATGVIHVLAVSGLHVGFILGLLLGLFKLLRVPQPWSGLLTIAGLLYYVFLTGCHTPVVRAFIMASLVIIAHLLGRKHDVINTLSAAAFVILVINPLQLFDTGFQLSFTAVCGIVLFYRKIKSVFRLKLLRWQEQEKGISILIFQLSVVSLGAILATAPLTAWYFGQITPFALFANLLVVPLVSVVVAAGFFSVLLSLLSTGPAAVFFNAIDFLLSLLTSGLSLIGSLPLVRIPVMRPSVLMFLLYYLLFGFIVFANRKNSKVFLIIIIVLLNIIIWPGVFSGSHLRCIFFDVGQGDAALFRFPDGKTLLVDSGDNNGRFDYGQNVIAPYLIQNGIKKIDVLLLTHPHDDHIGGTEFLMSSFKIGRIIKPDVVLDVPLQKRLDSLALVYNIPVKTVTSGDTLSGFVNTAFFILQPSQHMLEQVNAGQTDINNSSVVCKIVYGRVSFLMTGDAEAESEFEMQRFGSFLKSDLLKVAHHGSASSSGPDFVDKVAPDCFIVSVGRFNRSGLPSKSVMDRLNNSGCRVLRTDLHGAVQFESDGTKLRLVSY